MTSSARRPLRERKKERTRQALQDAALRLFAERGYGATTVDDIAEAADVSPRTFFRYFETKEDVVAWDPYDPLIVAELAARPAGEPPLTALREAVVSVSRGFPPGAEQVVLARLRLVLGTPALRARIYDTQAAWQREVAPVLARRAGRAPDDLAVHVLAATSVAALIVALDRWQRDGAPEPLADAAGAALRALESDLSLAPRGPA